MRDANLRRHRTWWHDGPPGRIAALLLALSEALRLRAPEIAVDTAGSAEAGLERLGVADYEAVVSDIKMPGMDGLDFLAAVRERHPKLPILLVTGHGDPLTDETLLHATMDVFRTLLAQGQIMKAKGLDPDQARDAIMPMLAQPMATITGGVAAREQAFKVQLVDWYLHRVYEELDGPLSDAIAAIPLK